MCCGNDIHIGVEEGCFAGVERRALSWKSGMKTAYILFVLREWCHKETWRPFNGRPQLVTYINSRNA